jgi:hypothetical protein
VLLFAAVRKIAAPIWNCCAKTTLLMRKDEPRRSLVRQHTSVPHPSVLFWLAWSV